MKFRWKVLLCNMILVAIAFAVSGYLLMNHSYQTSRDREVSRALEENQLIHAAVEAEILNMILRDNFEGLYRLKDVGKSVAASLEGTGTRFALMNELFQEYYSDEDETFRMTKLLEGLEEGKKNYVVYGDGESMKLAAASMFYIDGQKVYVVNHRDVTDVFRDRNTQIQYYQVMTACALIVCGIMMFLISWWITRPIEKLNRTTSVIAEGDYSVRVDIHSRDEIGELGRTFNLMAESVESHVNELVEENRRKEEFVANFTHEIKTPLTSVIGYADMIRSRNLSDETRTLAADYIFNEGMRLETMSMKLFELFLVNQEKLNRTRIHVEEWMNEIADSVRPMLYQAGMELNVETGPLFIKGDPDLLKTVFINMIDNGRKASTKGQAIDFRAYQKRRVVILEVRDHGHGIPADEIQKITEAFYMVDKSRSRESGGAGLGLALADRILKKHGAKLKIQSAVGKGTTMRVFMRAVKMPVYGEEAKNETFRKDVGGGGPDAGFGGGEPSDSGGADGEGGPEEQRDRAGVG
ncbi:MAG: HAMP domain-containing histidine kinase [Lachnospiraceae bacterium]|nr:HAMP domain-containing histidine kinase [Lachnospiraceae bacterium]